MRKIFHFDSSADPYIADAAVHRGPDLVVGLKGEAEAGQARAVVHNNNRTGEIRHVSAAGSSKRQSHTACPRKVGHINGAVARPRPVQNNGSAAATIGPVYQGRSGDIERVPHDGGADKIG